MTIDKVFEALASTPRRRILAYLSKTSLSAGDISDRFEMSKPAVSKHLKILENAGLVSSVRQGQFIIYSLVANPLTQTIDAITALCPQGGPIRKESAALAKAKKDKASTEAGANAEPAHEAK